MEVNNLVFVFIIILLVFWVFKPFTEGFSENTMEFVPLGAQRHDLRSVPLNYRSIDYNYISPNRHFRLNDSNGVMTESSFPPQGKNCRKVSCPTNTNEFDGLDTCWNCGDPGCVSPACASCADCASAQNLQKIWPH